MIFRHIFVVMSRFGLFICAFFSIYVALMSLEAVNIKRPRIALIPIGPVSAELLEWCSEQIPQIIDSEVIVAEAQSIPEGAFVSHRKQYLGDSILEHLRSVEVEADKTVGLIDRDCYAAGLNFIFGQASSNGKEAFVALPRLKQTFYGLKNDPELFRQRALKEIIHELGHTWGLPHCSNHKCIMHFSNTLGDTDLKGPDFCSACLNLVRD